MKKNLLSLSLYFCFSFCLTAQNIGINTATPDPSAKLDINATDAGLLIPRVSLNDVTNGITPINAPATSLLVYNTNAAVTGGSGAGFYYWNGTTWVRIGADDWSITGNANTIAGINFLGTTNGQALDFRTNNIQRFRVANGNQVHAMANGTAAAPFYSRSTDANTGMYFSAADQLGFSTAGIERVRIDAAGEVGIGTATPNDDLDVIGRAQISEYLRVGNPAIPQTTNPSGIQLYAMDAGSYYNGFTQGGCGTGWSGTVTGNTLQDRGGLRWDNVGARGLRYLYSPFMWVPSGATQAVVEIQHYCTLEAGFDGVYIEYSTDNGTTWTTVPVASFFLGGYNFFTDGSNPTCTANANLAAWSGGQDNMVTAFPIPVSGTWLQVRFVAMEDASVGTGEYYLFNFNVFSDYGGNTQGGAFANGNIYAENNIYAGSNVLLGDLAEYFPVIGNSKPGDLISMVPSNNEKYIVTSKKHDSYVIGVHSTNPTLTLNDPNSGIPVGLQGRVPVNVVGPIQKGEYLTASDVPGHAMASKAPGYIVGRALESFDGKGKGQILCLLESGWYNPIASPNSTTGTITVQPNQTSIKVINPSMQKEAKVFVSMLGNPKTWYWLAEKSDGSFTVEFEEPIATAVTFDYLIENANSAAPTTEVVDVATVQKGGQGNLANNVTQTATTKPTKNLNAPDVELLEIKSTFQIPVRTNDSPPTVPDTNKAYIWSSHIGLQEQAVEKEVSGQ